MDANGQPNGTGGGMPQQMNYEQQQQKQQEEEQRRKQMADQKNQMLNQLLDQDARARLNTIALAKPEKAQAVESMLVQMAQRGQLQGKMGERDIIQLLEQVSQKMNAKPGKVNFDRRRNALDSDDDDY